MTPFEKLIAANAEYHEAVEEIFHDEELDSNVEKRAGVKARFGGIIDAVFNRMKQANDLIAPYYEE